MGDYMIIPLTTGYSTMYFIKGEAGTVVVDSGIKGQLKHIIEIMKKNQISKRDIKLIVLTHSHDDHMGNLKELVDLTGAKLVVHKTEAQDLREGINKELIPTGIRGKLFKLVLREKSRFGNIEADITFEDKLSLTPYGIDGEVIHTPGHTSGSVSIILHGGEAIVGDLIMDGFIFKGNPTLPIFAYDIDQVKNSLRKLRDRNVNKIYISHGGPFEPKYVYARIGIG